MPLPPYHLGPGVAAKVFGGRHFSFSVFAFSQVLMDIEPLVRIYAGSDDLHGITNTMLGATVVGVCSVVLGKPVCEKVLRMWNDAIDFSRGSWLRIDPHIGWGSAIVSAAIGVYIHVILDAVMHSDAQPWLPFASGNPFFRLISVGELQLLCIGLGVIGLICLIGIWLWNIVTCEVGE